MARTTLARWAGRAGAALLALGLAGCAAHAIYTDIEAKALLEAHGYRDIKLVPDAAARLNPQGSGVGPAALSQSASPNGYVGTAVRQSDGKPVRVHVTARAEIVEY